MLVTMNKDIHIISKYHQGNGNDFGLDFLIINGEKCHYPIKAHLPLHYLWYLVSLSV